MPWQDPVATRPHFTTGPPVPPKVPELPPKIHISLPTVPVGEPAGPVELPDTTRSPASGSVVAPPYKVPRYPKNHSPDSHPAELPDSRQSNWHGGDAWREAPIRPGMRAVIELPNAGKRSRFAAKCKRLFGAIFGKMPKEKMSRTYGAGDASSPAPSRPPLGQEE